MQPSNRLAGMGDLIAKLKPITAASTLRKGTTLSGKGSLAISPRDKFIPGTKADRR